MPWPFVSRSRFEDLKAEHRELKADYKRLLDEVNYRNSCGSDGRGGFHLFSEFEAKTAGSEPITGEIVPTPKKEPEDKQIGSMREFLLRTEATNLSEFEEKRRTLLAAAAHKMNQTLEDADRAAAPGAD